MAENTSKVKYPDWTGADGEIAILVSRGEPNRTDLQMEQAVADQAMRYLRSHTRDHHGISDVALALMVQLIAKDYITPPGTRLVALDREHVLAYANVAKKRLGELAAPDAQG